VVKAGRVMNVTMEAPPAWETRSQVVRVYFQWNFSEACFNLGLACVALRHQESIPDTQRPSR